MTNEISEATCTFCRKVSGLGRKLIFAPSGNAAICGECAKLAVTLLDIGKDDEGSGSGKGHSKTREPWIQANANAERLRIDGLRLILAGRYREALKKLHEASESTSPNARIFFDIGRLFLLVGEPWNAVATLSKGAALDPQRAEIHKSLELAKRMIGHQKGEGATD